MIYFVLCSVGEMCTQDSIVKEAVVGRIRRIVYTYDPESKIASKVRIVMYYSRISVGIIFFLRLVEAMENIMKWY